MREEREKNKRKRKIKRETERVDLSAAEIQVLNKSSIVKQNGKLPKKKYINNKGWTRLP